MMNKKSLQNLRSFADLPKETHKEISRRGGINSGISRARTKIIELIITNVLVNRMTLGEGDYDISDEIIRLSELSNGELVQEAAQLGQDPEVIKRMQEIDKELDALFDLGDLLE